MRFRSSSTALTIIAILLTAAGPAAAAVAAHPRWRTVTYAGVSLRVPASWPVLDLARHPRTCPRLDVHAVYLGAPGPAPLCPAGLAGKTTAVLVEPARTGSPDLRQATRRVVIGGRPARTSPDAARTHTIIDVLPSAGVEISLSYGGSPALARSVEKTIAISGRARARALAEPGPVRPAAAQGVVKGKGFDTCAAPSAATMADWRASPYRSVGIYIGGVNRACAQASLTPGWIRAIQAGGWHYFPLYVGLQAPCVAGFGDETIKAGDAVAEGRAAADDAVIQAADLGIPAGTPIIYDMEAYGGGCAATVTAFLSAWDARLHAKGYSAGIYESFSNVGDLVGAAGQMTEPDVIHYADWDGHATTASPYMPASMWTHDQRIHQYSGGHDETYGGATLDIDKDKLDVVLNGTAAGGGGTGTHSQFRPGFRIAAALNSNGSAEWFATAANGTIRHNYQYPVNTPGWSQTRTVGNSPAGLTGSPAVAANPDGTLTLFALTSGGQVVYAWQQDGAPNGWHWSGAAGSGSLHGTPAAGPAAVRSPGGEVTVFVALTSGAVAMTRQNGPGSNSAWTAWTSLRGDCSNAVAPLVSGKTLSVFCTTSAGTLARDVLGSPGGWSGWQDVAGGPAGLAGVPAAVTGPGGQPEVVARTGSGTLAAAEQGGDGSWSWGTVARVRIRRSPAAVAWPGGGVAVLAQQANGRLGYALQSGGTGWSAWATLRQRLLGSPAAWANASGSAEVAVLTPRFQIAVAANDGSGWSSWKKLGGGY